MGTNVGITGLNWLGVVAATTMGPDDAPVAVDDVAGFVQWIS